MAGNQQQEADTATTTTTTSTKLSTTSSLLFLRFLLALPPPSYLHYRPRAHNLQDLSTVNVSFSLVHTSHIFHVEVMIQSLPRSFTERLWRAPSLGLAAKKLAAWDELDPPGKSEHLPWAREGFLIDCSLVLFVYNVLVFQKLSG